MNMGLKQHHGSWVLILSFIFGFMLAIMPLPVWAIAWRPNWVMMILIYWCLALPHRLGVTTGWIIGIIHDVLTDTLLGQHALIFCLIAYISVKFHRQIRLFSVWQQAITVFILVTISQVLGIMIRSIFGQPHMLGFFISPALTSMLLWPWLFIILRDLRRTYRVS